MSKFTFDLTGEQMQAALHNATKVEANPELAGSEEALESVKIGDTKYKIEGGGSLPEGTAAGNALVYDGSEWTQQDGYGYKKYSASGNRISWDGTTTGRDAITIGEEALYKVSSNTPTISDLTGAIVEDDDEDSYELSDIMTIADYATSIGATITSGDGTKLIMANADDFTALMVSTLAQTITVSFEGQTVSIEVPSTGIFLGKGSYMYWKVLQYGNQITWDGDITGKTPISLFGMLDVYKVSDDKVDSLEQLNNCYESDTYIDDAGETSVDSITLTMCTLADALSEFGVTVVSGDPTKVFTNEYLDTIIAATDQTLVCESQGEQFTFDVTAGTYFFYQYYEEDEEKEYISNFNYYTAETYSKIAEKYIPVEANVDEESSNLKNLKVGDTTYNVSTFEATPSASSILLYDKANSEILPAAGYGYIGTSSSTIKEWDGDTTGLTHINNLYLVDSDATPDGTTPVDSIGKANMNGTIKSFVITSDMVTSDEHGYAVTWNNQLAIVCSDGSFTYSSNTYSAGLWLLYISYNSTKVYVTKISYQFEPSITKIDSRLIPTDTNSAVKYYSSLSSFPETGSSNTLYVATDTNKSYIWTNSSTIGQFKRSTYIDKYNDLPVYESINPGDGGMSVATITIKDLSSVTIYIRSEAESNYDYTVAFALDTTATWDGLGVVNTKGYQSQWRSYTYSNISSGTHTIQIMYRKDSGVAVEPDIGFFCCTATVGGEYAENLPQGSAGTALVHNGTEWVAQSGYGYINSSGGSDIQWDGDTTSKGSVGYNYEVSSTYIDSSRVLGGTIQTYTNTSTLNTISITSSNLTVASGGWYISAPVADVGTIDHAAVGSNGSLYIGGATWPVGIWFAKPWSNTGYVKSVIKEDKATISTDLLPTATTTTAGIAKAISVSATGTATDEINYITVDGVEKKIAGGASYTAGTGINITDNTISVDTDAIQSKLSGGSGISISGTTISVDTDTIQSKLTAGSGISISGSTISADYTAVQEKLTAGTGINITNNVISSKVTYTLNGTELTITNTEA